MRKIESSCAFVQQKPLVKLFPGDVFRVSGGPFYKAISGNVCCMGSSGEFRFVAFYKQGANQWLEAVPLFGGPVERIYVGRRRKSPTVSGLILSPHRITKRRSSSTVAKRKRVKHVSQ
jgi:hypothetical protein